jgi:hypothetical protein
MKNILMFLLLAIPVFGQAPADVGALKLTTPGEFTGSQTKQHSFVAVGGIDMAREFASTCIGCKAEEAIAGGIEVPMGAKNAGNNGVGGYCVTHADSRHLGSGPPGEGANCVGGFFHAHAAANYSAVWGLNPVVNDVSGISGHDMQGMEIDMSSSAAAGPAVFDGIVLFMGSQKFPPAATGYVLYSDGKHPIPVGFALGQNATTTGEELFPGCADTGSETCASQTIDFIGTTSHVQKQSYLYADSLGDQMVNETAPNASLISTGGYSFQFRNNSSIATVNHKLAILSGGTTATVATTGSTIGVVGLVVNSGGTTGNATILVLGPGTCMFDGPTTAGHYFQASETIAGDCHDAGAARPRSNQNLGLITQSIGGAEGNATVLMELTP